MAKKDFAGKTKTSSTYDKDWVFRNGAWVTKRQARSLHADQLANKAARDARNAPAAPGVPSTSVNRTPATTAPIIAGQLGQLGTTQMPPMPTPATPDPGQPNVPSWWINSAIKNPATEDQKFANTANALLPTLAPEDQRTLATYLAQNYKDVYGGYANTQFSEAPTELNAEWRKAFLNPQRAQLAVSLMDRMRTASGGGEMGAGYDFLKNAVNLMNQFTTGGVMTREKYQQFQDAVANLGKNAGGDLSAYGNLAQLFNMPSFSAGPLVSNEANRKLFS
jgi:hypothetical protein